jgi:hypothetical protein
MFHVAQGKGSPARFKEQISDLRDAAQTGKPATDEHELNTDSE